MAGTPSNKVKRVPKRGHYDKEVVYAILENNSYCHVGFIYEGHPVVIPTAYGIKDEFIFLHGSMASRMMKTLQSGVDISICVTEMNGLVLAKSAFHHSMNYRSVVLFGNASYVEDPREKVEGLNSIVEHLIPGRIKEIRGMNDKEIKGTMLLKMKIDNASAKIRDEGANDDALDGSLKIWTGVLPIKRTYLAPQAEDPELPIPDSVKRFYK